VLNLQPGTDRFKVIRDVCAAAIRDQSLGNPIAGTSGVQHHQGDPGGFGRRDGPGENRPRIPFEYQQTPPFMSLQRKVHLASIDEPKLMAILGFVRMGSWARLDAALGNMGDVVIHQAVQGHDPPDRPHRDVRLRQEAPDPKLSRVRMGLLQVIDLHHQGQPDLARPFGTPWLVHQPGKVLRFEAPDPGVDRRARDPQEAADAQLFPAVIVEFDHFQAGLVAIRMAMIVPQAQAPLTRDGTLLPERLDRLVIHGIPQLHKQDAGEFAVVESVVEGLEPINLLPYGIGDGAGPLLMHHLDMIREESQHALLPKPACKGPHSGRVSPGLMGALLRCPIGEEDHGANHFVAPLDMVSKLELQLREVVGRHPHSPPA
jgi:hypothetical protein